MDSDTTQQHTRVAAPSLPEQACLPINRCNLPAKILGSLTYQHHPAPLLLDGIADLHKPLWAKLAEFKKTEQRGQFFIDYMQTSFQLEHLEEVGLTDKDSKARIKANYLTMLRGWHFDPDSREGAVLKGWVESRFGLLPRWHKGPISSAESEAYRHYMHERTSGIYNTNALEAQLDLLYSYCQYELQQHYPEQTHIRLYRGFNKLTSHDILHQFSKHRYVILLNNLNSFSDSEELASQFGDHVMQADIPLSKLFAYQQLLPGRLKGEGEHLVLGGVCEMTEVI